MNEQVLVILNQMYLFAFLMGIGFFFAKIKIFDRNVVAGLSKLIVMLLLPLSIFLMIAKSGATIPDFINQLSYLICAAIMYVVFYVLGTWIAKFLPIKANHKDIFILFFMFGNTNFFGVPLISNLMPSAITSINLSQQMIADNVFLWTLGIFICSRAKDEEDSKGNIANAINPTTISIALGLLFFFFQIPIPELVLTGIKGLGDSTKFLSMIYVGCLLSTIDFKGIYKEVSIFILILIKMIILPVLFYVIFGFFVSESSALMLAIICGLPSMITVSIMILIYGTDAEYATKYVFLTTIASLFTLPLVTYVCQLL